MEENGLIHAFLLDGNGGARRCRLNWEEISQWDSNQGVLWMHLDLLNQSAANWISEKAQLDEIVSEALLSEETRPRTTTIDDGILIALRGVNMNPGADPEDMVAIRAWIDRNRIISTQKRALLSVKDIAGALQENKGPETSGEFMVDLADRLISRMEDTVEDIEDRVAQLEEKILVTESYELRSGISAIRRESIMLRRYLAPQREAMIRLYSEKVSWLSDSDRIHAREATDRLIRHIEDLDSVRDRAAVTQEELVNKLSEQMNIRMYVLSLVAAIFLPLGFLTGLLGINVGGIPGAENKLAFYIFIFILIAVVALQFLLFKRKKWM